VKEVIRKRFELKEEDQKRDMMSSSIRHGMDRNDAVAEAALRIIAGTDTTATVIRIAMLHIITNPLVYTRLQSEIDDTSTPEGSINSSETARASLSPSRDQRRREDVSSVHGSLV
jgi:cytochrome P450